MFIVDNLWAITNVVLFFVRLKIAFCTFSSDSASKDEVASSSKIIGEFFKIALAIDILCFWPPESLTAFSPIKVLYLSGSLSINSSAAASLHASLISLLVAFYFEYLILFSTLSSKSITSWLTNEILSLKDLRDTLLICWPSNNILPPWGS